MVGLLDSSNFLQQKSPVKNLHRVLLDFFEEKKASSDADLRDNFLLDVHTLVATQKQEDVHTVFSAVSRFYDTLKLYQRFGTFDKSELEWLLSDAPKADKDIQKLIGLEEPHSWDGFHNKSISRQFYSVASRTLKEDQKAYTYGETSFVAGLQFHIAFQSRFYEPTRIYGLTQTLNLYAICSKEFIDGLAQYLDGRDRIVEIGSGHGVLGRSLKQRGINVTCTDLKPRPPFESDVREMDHVTAASRLRPKTIIAVGLPPFGEDWPSRWAEFRHVEEIILVGDKFDSGGMKKTIWNFERSDIYFGPVYCMWDRVGRQYVECVSFKRTNRARRDGGQSVLK